MEESLSQLSLYLSSLPLLPISPFPLLISFCLTDFILALRLGYTVCFLPYEIDDLLIEETFKSELA